MLENTINKSKWNIKNVQVTHRIEGKRSRRMRNKETDNKE